MTPNPQPQAGGRVRRDLYCRHAMRCLDAADQRRWHGIDCSQCPLVGREQEPEAASIVPPLYVYDAGKAAEKPERERAPKMRSGYPSQLKCFAVLAASDAPLSPADVSRRSGVPLKAAYAALGDLLDVGKIERQKLGRYRLVPGAQMPEPPAPVVRVDTQQERIRAFVAERARVTTGEVCEAFPDSDPRTVASTLGRLRERGQIRRLRYGVYGRVA